MGSGCTATWSRMASRTPSSIPPVLRSTGANAAPRASGAVRASLWRCLCASAGEKKVWSVVRVPSVDEEDRRQLHRELTTAKQDRTRVINRIKGLLAGHGVQLVLQGNVEAQLDQVHQWDGSPLPAALLRRLKRA